VAGLRTGGVARSPPPPDWGAGADRPLELAGARAGAALPREGRRAAGGLPRVGRVRDAPAAGRPDSGRARSCAARALGALACGSGRAGAARGVPATGGCRRSGACRRRSTPGVDSRRGGRGLDARNCPSHPAVRREHARIFLEARRRERGRPSRVNRAHPTGTVRPSELTRVDHAAPACLPAAVAPAVPVAVPVPPPRIVRPVWTPGTPERIAHVDAHEAPRFPGGGGCGRPGARASASGHVRGRARRSGNRDRSRGDRTASQPGQPE